METKQLSLFTGNVNIMTETELEKTVQDLYKNCIKYYNNYRGFRDVTNMTIFLTDEQVKNVDFIVSAYKRLYTDFKWCWSARFNYDETQAKLTVFIDRDTE